MVGLIAVAPGPELLAKEGEPVAIRRSDGCFVIESMWNLSVQIVTADQFRSTPIEGVDLMRHASETSSIRFRFRQDALRGVTLDHTLDRPANADAATWTATSEVDEPSANGIRVRVHGPVIVVDVDGLRITYLDPDTVTLDEQTRQLTNGTDVLIVGSSPTPQASNRSPQASNIESNLPDCSRLVDSKILVLGTDDHENSEGNTVAVRAGHAAGETRRTVLLDHRPLTLPVELETLMTVKEAACTASQEVFSKLSVQQMNFRPSNGSHTPRWNAEHMMGRELLFFSQIFSAQDAAIPVMDLNPKQMPPDYVPRHPDWTGTEEARQMQRVSAFTSRFAHLLKDVPLDEKAPGSRWTLRGLLQQMDRHYGEHTANVEKKFELEDWPQE